MKLTFYTISAGTLPYEVDDDVWEEESYAAQYGLRFEPESATDYETDWRIYQHCKNNNVRYGLIRGSKGNSCHIRFDSETERLEFVLKWF